MSKFVKAYLGIGVIFGCVACREAFKKNPKLLEKKDLVRGIADGILTVAIEWPFILIDAIRETLKKEEDEIEELVSAFKEGLENESES